GVQENRRARVRFCLFGTNRLDTDARVCGSRDYKRSAVRIDLVRGVPRNMPELRSDWSEGKTAGARPSFIERLAIRLWAVAMRSTAIYNFAFRAGAFLQRPLLDDGRLKRLPFVFAAWTKNRDFPALAKKSFRETWRDELGKK